MILSTKKSQQVNCISKGSASISIQPLNKQNKYIYLWIKPQKERVFTAIVGIVLWNIYSNRIITLFPCILIRRTQAHAASVRRAKCATKSSRLWFWNKWALALARRGVQYTCTCNLNLSCAVSMQCKCKAYVYGFW